MRYLVNYKAGFLLLLTVLCTMAKAQDKKEVEALVNAARVKVVPAGFAYYNLLDSGRTPQFDSLRWERYDLDSLLRKAPGLPVAFFQQETAKKAAWSWQGFELEKARIYSSATMPRFPRGHTVFKAVPYNISRHELDSLNKQRKSHEFFVPVKTRWSEKRQNREAHRVWLSYQRTVPAEDRMSFLLFNACFLSRRSICAAPPRLVGKCSFAFFSEGGRPVEGNLYIRPYGI